ncbi:hypothetical protein SUGI_0991740 [Cryptomeria japonica]|nr:hypothetical protein SUGI_0991740 [Cryptomeria japonica]
MELSKMKKVAKEYLDCDVKDVVIIIPTYFNDSQKRAMKYVDKIVVLNMINMINEPTATVICLAFMHLRE